MTPPQYLRQIMRNLPRIEDDILRTIVAVEAERMWGENFRMGGFTDTVFQPWQPRKKPESPQRALLVKTSTMKGHALKGRKAGDSIDFVFPLEYEKVHNEGLKAGRGQGFTMPKRQFIGKSAVLEMRIDKKVQEYITHYLNRL